MKIIFTSFAAGNENYRNSAKRIFEEAEDSKYFDQVFVYDDTKPSQRIKEFIDNYQHILNARGYGFWAWKPRLILDIFDLAAEGDIICYADSGCQISKYALEIFKKNIMYCKDNDSLFYQMPGFLEKNWTKSYLLKELNVENNNEIINSPMIQATYFYIKVNKVNRNMMEQWAKLSIQDNFKLINDEDSFGICGSEFFEHRHDQSILSILVKLNKCKVKNIECHYKNKEYYINSPVLLYPIHSLRNRNGNGKYRLTFKYSNIKYIQSGNILIKCSNYLLFNIAYIYKAIKFFHKKISGK